MAEAALRIVTVSDFNLANLNAYLAHDEQEPRVEAVETPFGNVHQLLMDPGAACWAEPADAVLLWTRPQAVVPLFGRVLDGEAVSHDDVLAEVASFAALLARLGDRAPTVLVPSWTMPPGHRGLGMLDLRPGVGVAHLLARMNLALAEALAAVPGFFLLDADRWLRDATRPYLPKSWYMGKFAFGNDVFQDAVADVKAALRGLRGQARKLVIVDLDETMWGGIVGEVGWEGLVLGGHDPEGEALVDFQEALKGLTNRGVALGIVSKNEESVALEAIDKHPEMRLRRDDFAGWRINWRDKAANVAELAKEVNLGLQSVVFLDDNPVERARVREALPEVLVPEWPADKTQYRKALLALRCFDLPALSDEDRQRVRMYAQDRRRKDTLTDMQSLDEWLHSLGMQITVAPLDASNLARAAQLLNKTNQMNLATRRMTEKEFAAWAAADGHWVWTFRVADKFGDQGLTGIVSLAREDDRGCIADFLLSCRVMGRRVEEAMIAVAFDRARREGLREVVARFEPTAKNKPCLRWWEESAFAKDDGDAHVFRLPTETDYPVPAHIELRTPEHA